jgi:hypothetical protein
VIQYQDHILPVSETPFNQALAALSARLEAINAPTRDVWDPWKCPPDFLKALAHAFSVDLWVDSWPDARKRSIIANAVRMHRRKGTLWAARTYLGYVDARLISATTPPQKVFSGPSLTRAEREAWLELLPQIRTWLFRDPGNAGRGMFFGSPTKPRFMERGFFVPSTALQRLGRRARWVVKGVETDTRVITQGSVFQLLVKGTNRLGVFSRTIVDHRRFFVPSSAAQRIVTVAPATSQPWRSPVTPHLDAVTSEPELVQVRGTRDRGVFSGAGFFSKCFVRDGFFRPSTALYRIFWRFAVNDGTQLHRRPAIQFMGVGRYGFPAHTARLKVSMPGKRSRRQAGEGIAEPHTRFWLPHDGERIRNARRALIASKRVSDKLLIEYADRPRIIAGQMFRAGIDTFIVGRPGATS